MRETPFVLAAAADEAAADTETAAAGDGIRRWAVSKVITSKIVRYLCPCFIVYLH